MTRRRRGLEPRRHEPGKLKARTNETILRTVATIAWMMVLGVIGLVCWLGWLAWTAGPSHV